MSGVEAIAVLGLISSIITIIDTTKKIYDAARDPKGLPEAFHEVADQLPIVGSTLGSAKQNMQEGKTNKESYMGVKHIIKACEKKAKKLEELFQKAIPAEGTSDLKRYVTAVKVWGKGNKVENLMKEILEDVQLLASEHGMKTATKDQQERIIKAITEVSAVSPSVSEHELQETGFMNANFGQGTQNNYNARGEHVAQGGGRQYISGGSAMSFGPMNFHAGIQNFSVSRPQAKETDACLRTLFLTDPRDDRAELITTKGPRVDGTCEWIKNHQTYKSWLRSQSQLLWLSGGPGKGKTMLSIFLAEELERTAQVSENTLCLQYFCDNKDEKRNTARAVLRGLIHQILRSCSKLFEHILPSFRQQREGLLSFETLWRIFASMVCDPALETIFCVLDGLDECNEASLEMLLGKFTALLSAETDKSSNCHLNLLIVSRDYPHFIQEFLSSFPRISLDTDVDTGASQDIDRFIKMKVKELSRRKKYSEELCAHVEKVLSNRAQGTFLWIGIAAHALRNYKATEVEEALDDDLLPPGLDALYARILLQIDSHRREIAARILRWVVMAVRPLTLSELSIAMETTIRPSSVPFTRDERIRDQISYCGHFLVLRGDEVVLVHYSAKDYLLRKARDPNPKLEVFRVKEEVANHEIARKCLDYLQSSAVGSSSDNPFGGRSHLRFSSFVSYALLHWHEHARSLAQSDDVFDLSQPFYHNESRTRALWLQAYCELVRDKIPRSFPLLHLASYFNIPPLAEKLVSTKGHTWNIIKKRKRPSTLEEVDSDGMTALMWATVRGHEPIVRLLLERGATTETRQAKPGERTETALIKAVRYGSGAIVQLLLAKGANTEARDEHQMTALMFASFRGQEEILRLLLKNEANVRAKDRWGRTVLSIAVRGGREAIVQLLLREGVDFETENAFEPSSPMFAAYHGHEAILQQILERGLDIDTKNSALMRAAEGGQEVTMQLLLGKGADINAKNEDGQTALMIIAVSGTVGKRYGYRRKPTREDAFHSQAFLQLLLERGADIHAADEDGETALMKAAVFGSKREIYGDQEAIVQLLSEKGADINTNNIYGETALMKAAELDRGADHEAQKSMIQLLLEKGADVNAQNPYGETALIKAAKSSYGSKTAVIQLLLEKGANIQAVTNNGLTALMKAVRRGSKSVVQLLLEKGADIDAKDIYGETALMKAAEYGHKSGEAVVQLLLEYGANVEAVDRNGTTALTRAQRKGHEGVVRLLTTGYVSMRKRRQTLPDPI